ncbi:hypothetical protein MPH_09684, partial [Macrophomina phaseolina MS6]
IRFLENVTRSLGNKAKNIVIPPQRNITNIPSQPTVPQNALNVSQTLFYAKIAATTPENDGFILPKKKKTTPKPTTTPVKDRQITVPYSGPKDVIQPLNLRNRLNRAFENAGFKTKPVVQGIRLSLNSNIVITGTKDYNAAFFLKNKAVIERVIL